MKLFIEGAPLAEIEGLLEAGLCDGVVLDLQTSPEAPKATRQLVERLFDLAAGPVFVPIEAAERDAMMARARALASLGDEVVVALPFGREGLVACRAAFDEGIATHLAPCFGPAQILMAAKAGATWVGLSVAEADAAGADGLKLVEDAVSLLATHDFEAQLVAAGLHRALQVADVALAGCQAAQLTPEAVWRLTSSPLSGAARDDRRAKRRR